MAKAAQKETTQETQPALTDAELYAEQLAKLKAELGDDQLAALNEMTGQDNLQGGSKTPVIRMNYQEMPDLNNKKIAKGNWVLGQVNGVKDGEEIVEESGTDLGDVLECTILKIGNQYSFWSTDAKQRCSSQVILEKDEVPIGYNLKRVCNDGTCPRRQEGLDKKNRCSNQFVVFVRLPEGTTLPNGDPCPVALLYIKGTSYMPFQDFIRSDLGSINSLMTTIKIKGKATKGGSNVYFIMQFKLGNLHDPATVKENISITSGVVTDLVDYKEQQAKKLLAAPAGGSPDAKSGEVDTSDGSAMNNAQPVTADDDDIPW